MAMSMIQPSWREVIKNLSLPARPDSGLWTVAIEYVVGPRKLKISARGSWNITETISCSPDGDNFASNAIDKCLSSVVPRGCLIAKVGGGSADRAGNIFPLGRIAVLELPDPATSPTSNVRGTLFLTMNDEPSKFNEHGASLEVCIWEAS